MQGMDTAVVDWIKEGLKKPGKSKGGLAQALGRSGSAVTAILNGTRDVKTFEVPRIASYLELSPPVGSFSDVTLVPDDLVPVHVTGVTEAGAFREANEFVEFERVTIYEPRDREFPHARQAAWDVAGDSMNALVVKGQPRPILPGDRVVTIDFDDLEGRLPLQDDMVVVVEQVRDGGHLREWSVKQLEIHDDRFEFHPRSTNPRHKPIVVKRDLKSDDGRSVRILALVRGIRSEVGL